MMKIAKKAERALDRKKETEQKNRDTVLLILSVGFLVGGVLGCLLEGKLSTEHYIGQFFQQAAQMSIAPSLWREVWIVFRWPVAVILVEPVATGRCDNPSGVFSPRLFPLLWHCGFDGGNGALWCSVCWCGVWGQPVCWLCRYYLCWEPQVCCGRRKVSRRAFRSSAVW